MTPRLLERRWIRVPLLVLTALAATTLLVGLWQDASALDHLGASLGAGRAPLNADVQRGVGGVLEHLGVRARVHAALAGLVLVGAVLSARPRWGAARA